MGDQSSDEAEETRKNLIIFGRDVSRMPCFRNSYLYGISGGLGTGLAYFMFTSRVRGACNFGVAAFSIITLSYWTQCRYNYSKTKFEMLKLQELMRQQNMYEGTYMEKELANADVQEV